MIRFESVNIRTESNGKVVLYPVIVFSFQETHRVGILKICYEYTIYYSISEKTWAGDIIDSSGWRDLTHDEVMEIVEKKHLERMI